MVFPIVKKFALKLIPDLDIKLAQAGIIDTQDDYISKVLKTSILMSIALVFISFLFVTSFYVVFLVIFFTPMFFVYLIHYVEFKIMKVRKEIDSEIIFATNFLIIELGSSVPMDKAFKNMETNYRVTGSYFGEIVNKVYLGTDMETAINETMVTVPSRNLRRILWQLLNSLKTGTDPTASLKRIVNLIVKDQKIAVDEYGKKLSPMAMFYMMISIIVPSLGITMFIIMATMIGLQLTMVHYLAIAFIIGFIQFMFLSMVKSMRPSLST